MKKIIYSEEGAASVLVIMIMVVMVVFGVLSLMTVRAEDKLASKSATWQQDYYALDGQGEEFKWQVAESTAYAKADAEAYIEKKKYLLSHVDNIPDDMQNRARTHFASQPPDEIRLKQIQDNVFYVYLKHYLNNLKGPRQLNISFQQAEYYWPNFIIDGSKMAGKPVATINGEFKSSEEALTALSVELEYLYPSNAEEMAAFNTNKWTLKSKQFEYLEQDMNLWDGQ